MSPPKAHRVNAILELLQEGMTAQQISLKMKVSKSRVGQVKNSVRRQISAIKQNSRILEQIKAHDDPDEPWDAPSILGALTSKTITQNRLVQFYREKKQAKVSLRELMDLLWPENWDGKSRCIPQFYLLKGMGWTGYWATVQAFDRLDFGPKCLSEWEKRRTAIDQHLKSSCPDSARPRYAV